MMPMIPTPDAIPTSWGYFQFFLLLTFPLHLFFMNALLGSSAVAIYAHLKGDDESRSLAYELAKVIPLLIALAVNFGVAPLLFVQVLYGHLFYASSVLMGVFWILIIPMLLVAYYATYWYDFRFAALGRAGILVLSFGYLLFLIIGFFLSNNMTLMLQPEQWGAYLENASGTLLNRGDNALWPRYLHFMVGGSAVGGLFVALYGRFIARRNPTLGDRATATGLKLFLVLTLVQIAVGVWFLIALPREHMLLFMGRSGLATASFVIGLVLVLAALFAAFKKRVYLTAAVTALLVYCMAFMRDFLRGGYLEDVFSMQQLQVVPQYSPMIFFLATLVIGLILVAWMIRAALTRCVP
jgi:hypothetical protein